MLDQIVELDTCGLSCPLPLLKAKKALNGLAPGTLLRVRATDTGSVRDFRVFCEQSGNELLESTQEHGIYIHLLRKRAV